MYNQFVLDNIIRSSYTAIMMIEATTTITQALEDAMLDNLIDWKLELTLQERLTRRQAMAYFIDEAPLTLAVALAPWIILLWLMH